MFDDSALRSRRGFLLAALAGLAAAGTLGSCALPVRRDGPTGGLAAEPATDWPASMVGDRDAARRFGAAYLRDHPAERDPEVLMQALASALREGAAEGAAFDRARLAAVLRGEYRRGEVVDVDGWLLSRSEARLYAAAGLR